MIVIDASTIAKYVLKEEHWEQVRDYLTAEPRSLDLALAEVSNAIWKHQVIYRKISSSDATLLFEALQKLGADVLILESFAGYLRGATEIAVKEKLTIYDALYIVQAQRYGHFVTSDDFQRKIAVKLGLEVVFIE
ncbi:PIN domain nuclease [ANME-1 cluster archaeon AG-394-G06]|nr:PIN domain nuclease [ANME-1 cluster archaeon AG-394-G06]